MELIYLDVDLIKPHDANVRRNLGDLTELAASIVSQGVLQPIVVAPDGDGYVLIAGHRRFAAATQSGMDNVPSIIRPDLDTRAKQISAMLVENLQRADLTVMEEAVAYFQLELLGVKPVAIAKTTGRSRKTVDSRLRLMTLPEEHRGLIDDGQLSLADAELLANYADDEEILDLGKRAGGLSWRIEMLLERRKREAERALEIDDDDEEIDNSEVDLERAQYEAERERIALIKEVSAKVRRDWILEMINLGSTDFWHGIARMCAKDILDDDNVLELFGISLQGEDESCEDAEARMNAEIAKWPTEKVQRFALLSLSDVLKGYQWNTSGAVSDLRDYCGYEPSTDELELMGGE